MADQLVFNNNITYTLSKQQLNYIYPLWPQVFAREIRDIAL